MTYKPTKSLTVSVPVAVYALAFVLVSMLIYKMNDDAQPMIGILRPDYLIPCVIYSSIVILISIGIFRIFKIIIQKGIALTAAVIFGVPVGIYILFQLTNWLFK